MSTISQHPSAGAELAENRVFMWTWVSEGVGTTVRTQLTACVLYVAAALLTTLCNSGCNVADLLPTFLSGLVAV